MLANKIELRSDRHIYYYIFYCKHILHCSAISYSCASRQRSLAYYKQSSDEQRSQFSCPSPPDLFFKKFFNCPMTAADILLSMFIFVFTASKDRQFVISHTSAGQQYVAPWPFYIYFTITVIYYFVAPWPFYIYFTITFFFWHLRLLNDIIRMYQLKNEIARYTCKTRLFSTNRILLSAVIGFYQQTKVDGENQPLLGKKNWPDHDPRYTFCPTAPIFHQLDYGAVPSGKGRRRSISIHLPGKNYSWQ